MRIHTAIKQLQDIDTLNITDEILINILALEKYFKEYEFIHAFIGDNKLKKLSKNIKFDPACKFLLEIRKEIDNIFVDEFPYYRKTYYRDLLDSVIAQTEYFVLKNKKKYSFTDIVERLFAVKLPPLFDIEFCQKELFNLLNSAGYKSIKDYKNAQKIITFKNFSEMKFYFKKHISETLNLLLKSKDMFTDVDLKKIINNNSLEIKKAGKNMPPCYYYYKSSYNGTMGVTFSKEYPEDYLLSLIDHEIVPGHHFYYLIREELIKKKKTDVLSGIDPFYSPETVINEGIALCSDLIFKDALSPLSRINSVIQKVFHKIMYNIWYSYFVLKKDYKEYRDYLIKNINMTPEKVNFWIRYYLGKDWRYYAVAYPIGSYYVENFLKKFGHKRAEILYYQQSVNTLKKCKKNKNSG